MKMTSRVSVALIAVGGLAAGAFAHPTLSESIGVDVWNVPALHDSIEREKRESKALTVRGETTLRRTVARQTIVYDVIDGRLTFHEAIQKNLELTQAHPDALGFLRGYYTGKNDLERSAKQLVLQIGWAVDPRGRALSQQLECEMTVMSWE